MSLLRRRSFSRKAPPRAPRAPVRPVERRGVYAVSSQEVVAVPKEIVLRSRPYRMWVASWPCDLCGWPETQCAHENGADKGQRMKVCDSRTFSLCVPHGLHMGCHYAFDNYIDITRDEARELGAKLSARMRERAIAAGWRFTSEGIIAP